jgi:hypothetical protein
MMMMMIKYVIGGSVIQDFIALNGRMRVDSELQE